AGAQEILGVLRGNVAPSPLFATNPSGSIAPENKMSFKRAVGLSTSNLSGDSSSVARLSRWLSYSSTYSDRIPLVANYNPQNGMAFGTSLNYPDNSQVVTFSTSGVFTNYGSATHLFGSGSPEKVTLIYVPQA